MLRAKTPSHDIGVGNGRSQNPASQERCSIVAETPMNVIRRKCIDCAGGSPKGVRFCSRDGLHSAACTLWPFRFGKRPATVRRGPDARFLNPAKMPGAGVTLEDCQ
jgi:hypothetical protein